MEPGRLFGQGIGPLWGMPHTAQFCGRAGPGSVDGRRAGSLKPTIQNYYRVSGSSVQLVGVRPDIILPSRYDAYEFGEAFQRHALKHDVNEKFRRFSPLSAQDLYRERLTLRSANPLAPRRPARSIATSSRLKVIEAVTGSSARICPFNAGIVTSITSGITNAARAAFQYANEVFIMLCKKRVIALKIEKTLVQVKLVY